MTPIRAASGRRWLAATAVAAVAAGGAGIYAFSQRTTTSSSTTATSGTPARRPSGVGIGTVTAIARAAAAGGGGGVTVRVGDTWEPLTKDSALPVGATIKTDERTRASLRLADGTQLVLDHATELAFDPAEPRRLTLAAGRLVSDIAHVESRPASIITPGGTVEVLGTKLVTSVTPTVTSVQVVRGVVAVRAKIGAREEVRAGEEALIEGGALSVGTAPSLAAELAWSEIEQGPRPGDEVTAGVGMLRAYKPGEKRDRDWKLALARHDVKVRIVGPIARTEITETFRNDATETLEGVYQFPLPADAQIDGLALDMPSQPGAFMEGAFLDKQRAQKIWQGVIDKATPMQIARPSSEIIWVPGPWRDPALLDWQRGGRFQLKVFPIPAKGARTIKISYTQVVTARGPFRQYVYPLAHSSDGSTVADQFSVDVEVRGAKPGLVRTTGYALTADPARTETAALTLAQSGFVPRGDLVIDYRPIDGDAELRAWTFAGGVAVAPDPKLAQKRGVDLDPRVLDAQRQVAADPRPTAVLALRPVLPRWRETRPRDVVIVLDASQSMVGERFTRASALAASLVEQMDRRDRFTIATCDSECASLGALRAPSAIAAGEVTRWLGTQVPAGASDVVASIRGAAALATDAARDRWVLFIGDGFATTGFRKAGDVEKALAGVGASGVHVTTIGIGGDADRALLAAAARGGGGSYLAWVPGQSVTIAALAALESTLGAQLRNATIELPAGLTDAAPTVLPTLRAGEELLLAARVTGDVKGDVVIRGTVSDQPFEQRYPVALAVSTAPGNAFVPRLWASLAIDQLERTTGTDRTRIVALSQAFGVMSKETSLLVLESDAMFEAFGVDRTTPTQKWTGEEDLDEVVAAGAIAAEPQGSSGTADAPKDVLADDKASSRAEASAGPPPAAAPATVTTSRDAPRAKASAPANKRAMAPGDSITDGELGGGAAMDDGFGSGMGRMRTSNMVPMRRVWVRVPAVSRYDGVSDGIKNAVANAEAALAASPDSREKHRALVQALSYAGEIDRAREVAVRWLERDKLDPQALGYQADLLGRDGQRDLALRTLAGLADLDPDKTALHERLARAYERVGRRGQACSHRIALAALAPKDTAVAGGAIRCLRTVGNLVDADLVAGGLPDDATRSAAEKAATVTPVEARISGDLVVKARWDGGADLDISLVTPAGERVSWMGGRTDAAAADVTSTATEQLALRSLKRGNYLIEVTRGAGAQGPLRGTVDVSVLGTTKSLPFELLGSRAVVARLAITLEARLEPVEGRLGWTEQRPEPRIAIGGIADAGVARVIRARAGTLRACYQQTLAREPSTAGRLDVTLSIEGDGRVSDVMAGGSMSPAVVPCVRAQLQRLMFPVGSPPAVTFSMVFQPS